MLLALLAAGFLTGCFGLAGVAVGAAASNIDPKPPKPETAENCKPWECFDGYACGPCPGNELPEDD
jgi:hypothetical protein